MRKNPSLKRLTLSRETLVVLSSKTLQHVAGGEQPVTSVYNNPQCSVQCPTQEEKKTCGGKKDEDFVGLAPRCPNQ
jgi:hypothetical protein